MSDNNQDIQHIYINNNFYNFIVDCAVYYYHKQNIEKSLYFCQKAAHYATFNYCGFYSEFRLENLLLKIANEQLIDSIHLSSDAQSISNEKYVRNRKKILHYATSIHQVGGHTRLIENWIKNDIDNLHDVVLTEQAEGVPDFIQNALSLVEGNVFNIQEGDVIKKASEIKMLSAKYDLVILHHHANDIIPVIAFSSNNDVPVCVLNHGDHRYWIGASVCDILIEIRDNIIESDRKRRYINEFSLLPIPIQVAEMSDNNNYLESRRKLGVKEDEIMLLSIGASYKYIPIDNKNFFEDVFHVIKQYEKIKLFVVGIEVDNSLATRYAYPNIVFIPPTRYIDVFKNACDIYVEGYPFSSFTAYLEVATLSKPIHRMYKAPELNTYDLFDYPNKVSYYDSKEKWRINLIHLISDEKHRLMSGSKEKANVLTHGKESWKNYLSDFYKKVFRKKHVIKNINPNSNVLLSDNDIYLHRMQKKFTTIIGMQDIYGLPVHLKMKLVYNKLYSVITKDKVDVLRILRSCFKL